MLTIYQATSNQMLHECVAQPFYEIMYDSAAAKDEKGPCIGVENYQVTRSLGRHTEAMRDLQCLRGTSMLSVELNTHRQVQNFQIKYLHSCTTGCGHLLA